MTKREYGSTRTQEFLITVEAQYGPDIAEECRHQIELLAQDDEFEPLLLLRDVKKAVEYSEEACLMQHSNLLFNS